MIGIDEALGLLERETAALEATELPLASLRGLALVEDVPTDRDFPPTDRSAMDGFAVRAADVPQAGESLEIVGEVRAGEPLGSLDVGPGQAVRIMTGAIVPPGADTVVMVEHTDEQVAPGRVRIDDVPRKGRHIRRRGEDAAAGQLAVERGVPLQAPEIAALASVGRATARVYRRPVVHVMSTGDEIVEPETVPAEYQLRNGNSRALSSSPSWGSTASIWGSPAMRVVIWIGCSRRGSKATCC
jgi:molybdopterin molybdotransferase